MECSETLLSHNCDEGYRKPPKWPIRYYTIALSFLLSCIFACLIGIQIGSYRLHDVDSLCTHHVSQYSPVSKDVDIHYNVVRFNGSFLKENKFRQAAGPEVDAAWASLGVDYRPLVVPADEAAKAGLLEDQVKVSPKYGKGFLANVEGLHHLHCLNLLRKSLYYNFEHYHSLGLGAFKNDDYILRLHVTHCLDILRQQLMCTVDIGVLGQVWTYPETPQPFVDFNTRHMCRNFEEVRKWAEEKQISEQVPLDYLQPPKSGDTVYTGIP
ncbi:hypothetical protein V496_01370 [Pseudogymnoascus sp. VKM F-4515 (FW-2607)]|nr:hypothetical protein V496_01370 [Pseudogymnoascus sp. VKM F-4515 (FW-2607)]KFY94770.1 hypothetical protein V498_03736 [Pseudogymnoascus sp. VKM F-4517 (FW-2822)]